VSTQTVGELLGRCLLAAGAGRVFGSAESGIRRIPGLRHVVVSEPGLAVLLADADGRIGTGPGVALLPGRRLHLGSQPGEPAERLVLDDPSLIPSVIAGWSLGRVHASVDLDLSLDLDAPAPSLEPLRLDESSGEVLTLSPTLAGLRSVVLAGPGVLRAGQVEALRSFAEQAAVGVVNTWGAKGVFAWDSPFHLGTAGLQARDFELAGLGDAELLIVVGVDPLEAPRDRWGSGGQVLEVEPWQLAALAWRWERPERVPERPALYTRLAAALAPLYDAGGVPLNPARAAAGLASARPPGGLVLADPGPAGLWVARAFPTTEPGSVVVPAAFVRGFAAAAAVLAGLDGRPAIAVVTDPPDEATLELLSLADHWGVPLTLEVWGAEVAGASVPSAAAHAERLAQALDEPGVKVLPVPVDFAHTRTLVEVAGEVVAWTV
jgi:thiamine pyrophosphate-dependent acetolactate synthase large subunit-like protein